MKTTLFTALAILTATFVTLSVAQWRHSQALKAELAAAHAALQAEARARETQQMQLQQLERERTRITADLDKSAAMITALRAAESRSASNLVQLAAHGFAVTNGASDRTDPVANGPFGNKDMAAMVSKMLNDPDMKEMMQSQQRVALQQMYAPLFKDLNLTAAQKKRFLELLSDNQLAAMDHATNWFNSDSAVKTSAMVAIKDRDAAMDDQIKALLGDEKFAQYEDYKRTMSERLQLDQFKQQLQAGEVPLTDQQMASLLQVMTDERAKGPTMFPEQPGEIPTDLTKMFSAETLEKQFQWQEDYNRRLLERARTILTPQQLQEFSSFQAQQLNMQKLGMKMASEFMDGSKTTPPTPKPPPAQ